jgi:hypothetical protein
MSLVPRLVTSDIATESGYQMMSEAEAEGGAEAEG